MALTALVIDDSRVMRNMVITSLRRTGLAEFAFLEGENGADGLSKFDPGKIDMVFIDWNMPEMTGVEFVRRARALGGTGHIPMIMVTSEKTVAKMEEALDQAGADAFVSKPFTVEELQQKLSKYVDKAIASQKTRSSGGILGKLFS